MEDTKTEALQRQRGRVGFALSGYDFGGNDVMLHGTPLGRLRPGR